MTSILEAPANVDREQLSAASKETRLSTLARWALDNSPYRTVSLLDCQVIDGVIILSGVVSSFHLKQLAQEVLLRLDCDNRIDNRVDVLPWPAVPDGQQQ